jgi:EAL domain-containing protein (putative c-di-GMP-specific phosphodiesterase class I)
MTRRAEPLTGQHDRQRDVSPRRDQEIGLQLLLVASNPRWTAAVHAVAAEIGGSEVLACDARSAVARLACGDRFSHVLLEDGCADGLLDTLADMISAQAYPGTSLLLLGASADPQADHGVICAADRQSVRRALIPGGAAAARQTRAGSILVSMTLDELYDALAGTMIEARYQPIVRMADRQPVALEALARLRHPAHGTLSPCHFVPQIEGAGLAARLTQLVSARMFADLTGPFLSGRALTVALNFPLDVMLQPAALDHLEMQRAAAGVLPAQVVIELTESLPVEDMAALRRSLEHLRGLGYGVSIDDVGPTIQRLDSLLQLPFTCVKLDKDIVQCSEHDVDLLAFLRRTIATAHANHMSVVAEGVATAASWDLMRSLDVDEAQGFLIARPLPAAAVPVWLDAWQRAPASPERG